MVGAVTGAGQAQACAAILKAAAEDNEYPDNLVSSSFRHQCRAIELLRFGLYSLDGQRVEAKSLPKDFKARSDASTIEEFVRENERTGVLACFAGAHDKPDAHSFAVEGHAYFDNNVGDHVVTVERVPEMVRNYRMAACFVVRRE